MKNKNKLVSLVLPVYNEVESLPLLISELQKLRITLKDQYQLEILFVDDGSTDGSVAELHALKASFPHHLIEFSRNFGHQAALIAGLIQAQGDVIVTMDSDLQHPPIFIRELLAAYEAGAEIVFTKRVDHQSLPFFKRISSRLFYKCLNLFSTVMVPESSSDFRLMNRTALEALLSLSEKRIFLRGMVSWIGFKSVTLEYQAATRQKGESKYNFLKMCRLAIYGISSFSSAPLYLSAFMGLVFSLATVLYGCYVMYIRFVLDTAVAGWSSVIFILLAIGSILSFLMAILGIYVAALYDETKQRPIFIIRK